MDDSDRTLVREAAEAVEAAESRVIWLVESPQGRHQDWNQPQSGGLLPDELAKLREIRASLSDACTRMWSLCEESRE
jgi:hypothetical protein